MATLDISHVSKTYGAVSVLKDIDISVADGEFLVLVGPSGCGKSTLLSIIAGLDELTSGAIRIDGRPVRGLEPKERDIAMVFQSYALYPSMTVEQNIGFSLEMGGVPKPERKEKVAKVAELLQITHLLSRKPGQLSGGQRQRVAMGRALVRQPKIFLFDEPLSNLDAKLRVEMRTEIKKLHLRLKSTIVYVTHDQIEAMTMATRIAVMKDGILQQFGSPEDIYDRPANTFVATFMGSPAMNLVPSKATVKGDRLIAVPEGTENQLHLPRALGRDLIGKNVTLGLRPEWINAQPSSPNDGAAVEMDIEVIEPTGPDIFVGLRMGGREIMARFAAGTKLSVGERRPFWIDLSKAVIFDGATGVAI